MCSAAVCSQSKFLTAFNGAVLCVSSCITTNLFCWIFFWTRNWSHITTHRILWFFWMFLFGRCFSKKAEAQSFQIELKWNLAGFFFKWTFVRFLIQHHTFIQVVDCCICSRVRWLPASSPSACDIIGSLYELQLVHLCVILHQGRNLFMCN